MDHDVILVKIESIQRCLKRISIKLPSSVDILKEDIDAQDIILLNLERLIQQTVDVALIVISDYSVKRPDTMAESFRVLSDLYILDKDMAVRLAKSVGFRNIAVHEYQKLNMDILWNIVTTGLKDFKDFSKGIIELLN